MQREVKRECQKNTLNINILKFVGWRKKKSCALGITWGLKIILLILSNRIWLPCLSITMKGTFQVVGLFLCSVDTDMA